MNAGRSAMPSDVIKIIKQAIQKRSDLENNLKFSRIWTKCKNSINGLGRYQAYKKKQNDSLNELHAELNRFLNGKPSGNEQASSNGQTSSNEHTSNN
jgi:hypothetical protein